MQTINPANFEKTGAFGADSFTHFNRELTTDKNLAESDIHKEEDVSEISMIKPVDASFDRSEFPLFDFKKEKAGNTATAQPNLNTSQLLKEKQLSRRILDKLNKSSVIKKIESSFDLKPKLFFELKSPP